MKLLSVDIMSRNVQHCIDHLKVLSKCNTKQRRGIIETANPVVFKAICECSLNVVKGNIPLTPTQKRQITPYKNILRSLADRNKSFQAKKRILIQKGGFLPILLRAIVPTIASLLLK